MMDHIRAKLAEIESYRASLPPVDRAELERLELIAQRESWIRAMAPCEHGVADFEQCSQCRNPTTKDDLTEQGEK